MDDPRSFWNARFATPGHFYGTAPNDFLVEVASRLKSPVLSLGEGQGRNAVYLAERGLAVTGVDASDEGPARARSLAAERGVEAAFLTADLASFELGVSRWGSVYSIFCHLPVALRRDVHRRVVAALVPGGTFILEAYTPRQLAFDTGGPRSVDMLVEPADLEEEVAGLIIERLVELERDVLEGEMHRGRAAVVQLVAHRPG